MIPYAEALRAVLRRVRPLGTVRLPLEKALHSCLAEDVRADRDLPPADRSAMDGFAVRSEDLASAPRMLRLVGEVAAGIAARPRVRPGTCARVLTGANIPPGADTVAMVEQTRENDGHVRFLATVESGANIFRKAEDARRGETLLPAGTLLGPMQVGVCAAVGRPVVHVHRRPRIALLCTGAELRGAGDRVGPHETRNSNGPTLRAALQTWGFGEVRNSIVADGLAILMARLRRALLDSDVVLITGGMAGGKYDFASEAVRRVGGRIRFHGVAMKPGKPALYADLPANRHVFGLPGNPLSAMTCFYEFVLPALRRLSGLREDRCRPSLRVPLAEPVASKGGRVRLVLARLGADGDGLLRAEPVPSRSSADLVSGGRSDGAVVLPAEARRLEAGTLVEFRPWRPWL